MLAVEGLASLLNSALRGEAEEEEEETSLLFGDLILSELRV